MSNTRGKFPQISSYDLRSTASLSIDTGIIPTPVTSQVTKGGMRGMEANTARGVTLGAPQITGVTPVEYAPSTDQPQVMGFRTYGSN